MSLACQFLQTAFLFQTPLALLFLQTAFLFQTPLALLLFPQFFQPFSPFVHKLDALLLSCLRKFKEVLAVNFPYFGITDLFCSFRFFRFPLSALFRLLFFFFLREIPV